MLPFKLADRCAFAGCVCPILIFALLCLLGGHRGPAHFCIFLALTIMLFVLSRPHIRHSLRCKLGWGASLAELARRLDVSVDELCRFRPQYEERLIPKRRGGMRRLFVPSPETKELQRRILHRLLAKVRAHDAAHGFERNRSIVTNARQHTKRAVVVTLDIVAFFERTKAERIEAYFRRIGWNGPAAALLTRICTYRDGLPQGAPTSPRLSNLVNYGLDEKICRRLPSPKIIYTRYADDMTISFPRDFPCHVRGIIQLVRRVLRQEGYELHGRKTRIMRRHQQQKVTGLVVNDRVSIPRRTRRWLRAIAHRLEQGETATLTAKQLAGWQALMAMVEVGREFD